MTANMTGPQLRELARCYGSDHGAPPTPRETAWLAKLLTEFGYGNLKPCCGRGARDMIWRLENRRESESTDSSRLRSRAAGDAMRAGLTEVRK